MDIKLTDHNIWQSTLTFGLLGLILSVPLLLLYREESLRRSARLISISSAIFWGALATAVLIAAWKLYYQYLYPAWMRWLAPADALIYGLFALIMWWLAMRLPGHPLLWFLLLGGLEGILEHIFGIYGLHILDKVPWLQGISPFPVLIFSFFEYIVYWAVVGWISYGWLAVGRLFR
jgi:hypothetical protein